MPERYSFHDVQPEFVLQAAERFGLYDLDTTTRSEMLFDLDLASVRQHFTLSLPMPCLKIAKIPKF